MGTGRFQREGKSKMEYVEQPSPADLRCLKEIVDGRRADRAAIERLKSCRLVEEFNGTALLTERGVQAALKFV